MKRQQIYVLVGIIALFGLGVVYYLAAPLFINRTVDEAFPVELPSLATAEQMSSSELEGVMVEAMAEVEQLSEAEKTAVSQQLLELSTLMDDKVMEEPMPVVEPVLLAQGSFVDIDAFYQGEGNAAIFTLPTGERILRFEDFQVTNGPDLHVILSKHPNPTNRDDIGTDYIDLGSLKGNIGNQNYEIPADIDLSEYQSIVIYCVPFHVLFSVAPLS